MCPLVVETSVFQIKRKTETHTHCEGRRSQKHGVCTRSHPTTNSREECYMRPATLVSTCDLIDPNLITALTSAAALSWQSEALLMKKEALHSRKQSCSPTENVPSLWASQAVTSWRNGVTSFCDFEMLRSLVSQYKGQRKEASLFPLSVPNTCRLSQLFCLHDNHQLPVISYLWPNCCYFLGLLLSESNIPRSSYLTACENRNFILQTCIHSLTNVSTCQALG